MITIEARCGEHVNDTAKRIFKIKEAAGEDVETLFNDVRLTTAGHKTWEEASRSWGVIMDSLASKSRKEREYREAIQQHKVDCFEELLEACKTLGFWLKKLELADVFPDKFTGSEFSLLEQAREFAANTVAKAEGGPK